MSTPAFPSVDDATLATVTGGNGPQIDPSRLPKADPSPFPPQPSPTFPPQQDPWGNPVDPFGGRPRIADTALGG